jgi:hypothetical protein
MKSHVTIPAQFCDELNQQFLNVSNQTVQPIVSRVSFEDSGYSFDFELSREEIFALSRLHEVWQSSLDGTVPATFSFIARTPLEAFELTFSSEDLGQVFFVVDKVRAGAESVPLIGEVAAVPFLGAAA